GKVPDRLYPVFRDRTDVSAGSRMEGLKDELDASQSMILICSPKAAASDPVEKEIIHFKSTRPGARILPIIVDGEPGAKFQAQDCFPKA
ncbi:toll/interleukin-1 receptor domain-containing protein, partial [Acinetobacter baumannii]